MSGPPENPGGFSCPVPLQQYPVIQLAHGGGGRLMQNLLEHLFYPAFDHPLARARHDGTLFEPRTGRLAMTTDSYVVRPLEFPGGDIGTLSVYGTVNDLAMCGARPRYLSAGFILEEGLPMETLVRVVESMKQAAKKSGVGILTGDTKVVDRGRGDGIYLNTTGIGELAASPSIRPRQVQAGDVILLSGDVGRHGMAVMSRREGLQFENALESDCAPVHEPVLALLEQGVEVHCLRDCTRGGLASALIEIARTGGLDFEIDHGAVPVAEPVQGACEILGLDPLYVACEGRFIAFVPEAHQDVALETLHRHPVSRGAVVCGRVRGRGAGQVTLRSAIGAERVLDWLSGEQLPRIC